MTGNAKKHWFFAGICTVTLWIVEWLVVRYFIESVYLGAVALHV